MEFLSQQVSLPFWLVLLMIAGLIPLFIKIFVRINSIRMKIKRLMGGSDDEELIIDSQMKTVYPAHKNDKSAQKSKRIIEAKVLKLLATNGDQGMLLQSIADTLKIDSNNSNHALKYLEGKKMVEAVTSMGGDKYFLTAAGKNYCRKKGYIRSAA